MRSVVTACGLGLLLVWCTPARAVDTPEAAYLLPSQVSELQYVYDTMRQAARRGNVVAFRELSDPRTMHQSYTDITGRTERLTPRWLRARAGEWPDVRPWALADASGVGEWARLTFRHAHLIRGRADGRWDFYFLVFRHDGHHWRLTRRAIATFGVVGAAVPPPRVADLTLVPSFELPPGPVDPTAFATGE